MNIPKHLVPVITKAQNITVIANDKALEKASDMRAELKRVLKGITEDKEKITKPMLASLKEIRAKYAPQEEALESSIGAISLAMSDYETSKQNALLAEKEAIAARIAPGKGNLKLETA